MYLNLQCLTMSFPACRGSPEVYGRHCNNFHPESLINVLRIYVFKFVMFIEIYSILQVRVPNFEVVAGSEDFACATLRTTPLDFQGKIENFCHSTLLKIRFKITVTPLK